MKDKELRHITYNSCKELEEKVNFLYEYIKKHHFELSAYSKQNPFTRLPPTGGMSDGSIPDDRINWRHLKKCGRCKIE